MGEYIPAEILALFESAGSTGAYMLTVDWGASPLGPIASWPQSLRTAVSIVLSSRHPLLIWWGPELVMLYNDALAPSFGDKHPHAVGRPGAIMFAEMWDVIGPMLHSVLETGQATWRYDEPLPMDRRGFLEDTYWTYSYSPILDEAGGVAGVFTATSETTDRVLRERRLRTLQAQAAATDGARSTPQLAEATARALGEHRADVAFAAVYLLDEAGTATLAARTEAGPVLPMDEPVGGPPSGWPLQRALAERRPVVTGQPGDPHGHAAVVLPVTPPGGTGPAALLVGGIVPAIHFDVDYEQFFLALGGRLAVAITEVEAHAAERRRAESLAALHVARIEAASKEHQIADELQRTLLPSGFGNPPGLEVAAHYRAGVEGTRVGGDWYDVIELGGSRTGLVIGDVMGRGVTAAAIMGQIRTAIRAYALLDMQPAHVLNLLDTLVRGMAEDHIATCVYGIFDAEDGSLRYANAGHPPPLLLDCGGASPLPSEPSPPLGSGLPQVVEGLVTLAPGTVLALYTDGLVEQRGQDLEDGIVALQDLLATRAASTGLLGPVPSEMVRALRPGGLAEDDDIALLLVRVPLAADAAAGDRYTLTLAPEPRSARTARRYLQALLAESGHPEWQDDAQLAVSEVVTNAVLHAHTPIFLQVSLTPTQLRVEVRDTHPALPTARVHSDDATTGRGMGLLSACVSDFGVTLGAGGSKTVWFAIGERSAPAHDRLVLPEEQRARPQRQLDELPVRLVRFPAVLWLAAQPQHEALLRELALISGGGDTPSALVLADHASRLLADALDRALAGQETDDNERRQLPPGHPSSLPAVPSELDLELLLPPGAGPAFTALQDQLDEAGELAAAGRMLARPCLPEIIAVRDWVSDQVVAQLAGISPSPWPGTDAERFVTQADPRPTPVDWDVDAVRQSTRGAIAADDANRILAISQPLADRLGWTPGDLIGRRVVAIVPSRFREAHVAGFTRHLATGQAHALGVELHLPVLCRDGTEIVCAFFIEAHTTAAGRSLYVAWITPPDAA